MIALWYNGDTIERAEFQDGRRRIVRMKPMPPAMPLDVYTIAPVAFAETWVETSHTLRRGAVPQPDIWVRWDRDARRYLARSGRGPGRRRAAAVPRGKWVAQPPRPDVEALLYLPDGQRVDQWHINDVERWLDAKGRLYG